MKAAAQRERPVRPVREVDHPAVEAWEYQTDNADFERRLVAALNWGKAIRSVVDD